MSDNTFKGVQEQMMGVLANARGHLREAASIVSADLAAAAYPLFSFIGRNPRVSAREVAKKFALDKGVVSRHICHLEELGLVTRSSDPHDRRVQVLELSELGERQAKLVKEYTSEKLEKALASWSQEEVNAFESLLEKFNRDFKN